MSNRCRSVEQMSAASGAQLLDRINPGWAAFHRINAVTLDVKSSKLSPLAQLYGTFSAGVDAIEAVIGISLDLVAYGLSYAEEIDGQKLSDAWRVEICARRIAQAA